MSNATADAWIIGEHELPPLGDLPPAARFGVTGVETMGLTQGQHVLVHDFDLGTWTIMDRVDFDDEYEFL